MVIPIPFHLLLTFDTDISEELRLSIQSGFFFLNVPAAQNVIFNVLPVEIFYLWAIRIFGITPCMATILTRKNSLLRCPRAIGVIRTWKAVAGFVEEKSLLGVLRWKIGRSVTVFSSLFTVGELISEQQAEERARKRIKLLLPQERRSPSPPVLPHLARSPSPPLVSPYPPPNTQHLSYTSFVMDKSITHTFRSGLLDELEQATNGLIEGEATLKRALGRLWQVMSENPGKKKENALVPKREDEDDGDGDDQTRRMSRTPDMTPPTHKIFLSAYPPGVTANTESSNFVGPENQLSSLEKNIAILRELQDDGREYTERLEEIREGLGDVRAQRDVIWNMVRGRALKELQEAAISTVREA
jgi:hypothetical protein